MALIVQDKFPCGDKKVYIDSLIVLSPRVSLLVVLHSSFNQQCFLVFAFFAHCRVLDFTCAHVDLCACSWTDPSSVSLPLPLINITELLCLPLISAYWVQVCFPGFLAHNRDSHVSLENKSFLFRGFWLWWGPF